MDRSTLLSALLTSLLLATAACDSTVVGGGDLGEDDDTLGGEGGAGGGEAEEGEGGEGGDDAEVPPPPSGTCAPEPRPSDCLYDAAVCQDGTWICGPTPLVLSFDGQAPELTPASGATFDLGGVGERSSTDWPTSATPWLALDRDGDGAVSGGAELFGSAVRLADGSLARHGFEALAELDANGDRRIDAADPAFARLLVWADLDADRASTSRELTVATEGSRRLVAVELDHHVGVLCDARHNCGVERATFHWMDEAGRLHAGEVVDVHLPTR